MCKIPNWWLPSNIEKDRILPWWAVMRKWNRWWRVRRLRKERDPMVKVLLENTMRAMKAGGVPKEMLGEQSSKTLAEGDHERFMRLIQPLIRHWTER